MSMGDVSSFLTQMAQSLGVKTDAIADNLKVVEQAIADKANVVADSKVSSQQEVAKKQGNKTDKKLKTGAKKLIERMKKMLPPEKVKEAKEVEGEVEEKSLEEVISELKGKRLPQDEELNRNETARYTTELAEKEDSSAEDIIEYLIQPTGPYGKRPDQAEKPLTIAVNEMARQVKMLKAKHGEDHQDVRVAVAKLDKLQKAKSQLMQHVEYIIGSATIGIPTGRVLSYKSKIRQDTLKKIPLFKDEAELKKALKELDNLPDPTAHYQWCTKYDYEQILAVYAEYARETSEILNSEASSIPRGLLNNRIKVLQNNTSFKFVNRVFGNELIWAIKQWDHDVGPLETETPTAQHVEG